MEILFFYYATVDSCFFADAHAWFWGVWGYAKRKSDYQFELAKLYGNKAGCSSSADELDISVVLFSVDTAILFPDDIFERVCAFGNSFIYFSLGKDGAFNGRRVLVGHLSCRGVL